MEKRNVFVYVDIRLDEGGVAQKERDIKGERGGGVEMGRRNMEWGRGDSWAKHGGQ